MRQCAMPSLRWGFLLLFFFLPLQKQKVMEIIFLREVSPGGFENYKKGEVYEIGDSMAKRYIELGYALPHNKPANEFADVDPEPSAPTNQDERIQLTAKATIEQIKLADSVEAVDLIIQGDERATVLKAADKRKKELQ